jgi:acetyltransferase-like isoleucine patch superfamily enzyme
MAYMTEKEISKYGFKKIGKNVQISTKASYYNCDQIEIDDYSRIDDYSVLSGKIKIGRFVHIAPGCLVAGGEKGVIMGDFSGLAYHVIIFSQSDDYSGLTMTNPTVPDRYKREKKLAVIIGRHVIIGTGSIVFPGVNIADGCSIGALSCVQKSTEPFGIYTGNPAIRIKDRKKNILALEKKFLMEIE